MAQQTAQGWLVRELTPDPRLIAIVAACNSLPVIFLSLYAGAIADRVDRRRALLIFNLFAALLALLLAVLVWLQIVQVWHVILFALANGIGMAFDVPIRQSFNREMVGMNDLPSAIALNSTAFNTARVAGPAVGGMLIQGVGLAGCFFINTLSFVALIAGLLMMKLAPHEPVHTPIRISTIWKGILYVRRHSTLKLIVLLVAVVSFAALSYGALMAVFAKDVLRSDAAGFSTLVTCGGVGSLMAATSQALMREMRHRGKRLLLGAFLSCLCVMGFAVSPNVIAAGGFLLLAGYFQLVFLMTANTMVQMLSPDSLRGRIFSLYSLALIGANPLGAILLGVMASQVGARIATFGGACFAAAFVLFVFWKFRSLWKER